MKEVSSKEWHNKKRNFQAFAGTYGLQKEAVWALSLFCFCHIFCKFCTIYCMFCILYLIILYFILCASYCILYICILHCTLCIIHFMFCFIHNILTLHSTDISVPQAYACCSHCISHLTRSEGSGKHQFPCQQQKKFRYS